MKRSFYFWLSIGFIVYLFDRLIKLFFLKSPNYHWDFFNPFLQFDLAGNQGIAFGWSLNKLFIIILSFLIILIILYLVYKFWQEKKYHLSLASYLIILGAVSNLIDRLRFGFVIDYINVSFFTIFNLADCLITVGVVIFVVDLLFLDRVDKKQNLD